MPVSVEIATSGKATNAILNPALRALGLGRSVGIGDLRLARTSRFCAISALTENTRRCNDIAVYHSPWSSLRNHDASSHHLPAKSGILTPPGGCLCGAR